MTHRIGVADTMFARVDMFKIVKKAISDKGVGIKLERYTVPGIKDLPVACKKLIEEIDCEIVIALGMPGPEQIDKQCAHEASMGIIQVQLLTNKHILEVFVHMDEGKDDKQLHKITYNRTYDHALNALKLLEGKEALSKKAGKGIRQGHKNEGNIKE
ncbi:MAG: riboflavin synthase [Nanoarchaeota archaeon]|nr:riboflavin synthase [Nanoarchaeota archaeon]